MAEVCNFGIMYRIISCTLFLVFNLLHGQKVLHFTKTSGFDHNTRDVSFAMFTAIGIELEVDVDDDSDGSSFNELSTLEEYDVIVFANTSGDAILDADQRANFEAWVAAGGNVMGIHAASDTYRHSTANGGNTGVWDFYAELIGGSVQTSPNHVSGTPSYALSHIEPHPSTANLPDPWEKEEEYYYWENGYYHQQNIQVLEVEETVGPNGLVNSYDLPRPISWYRITNTSRIFYTALGHASTNFTSDDLFRTHIRDALAWLLEENTSIEDLSTGPMMHHFDEVNRILYVQFRSEQRGTEFSIWDIGGQLIHEQSVRQNSVEIGLQHLNSGVYYLRVTGGGGVRFIVP